MLKIYISSGDARQKIDKAGKKITEITLKVLVKRYDLFSFKVRNKTLQQIEDTNLYFLHKIHTHQFSHFNLIISRLNQYCSKATGRGHFSKLMKLIHFLLIHFDSFLAQTLNPSIAKELSQFCSYLSRIFVHFKDARLTDSEELLISLESILSKLLRIKTLGNCPSLHDLYNLFTIELYLHPECNQNNTNLPQSYPQFNSVFIKAKQYLTKSEASSKLLEILGLARLLYSLCPLLSQNGKILRDESLLELIDPFLPPQDALIYALPLLVQLSKKNIANFQKVIGISQQEITLFQKSNFSYQLQYEMQGFSICSKNTAMVSLFNSRYISMHPQLQLLQMTTQLALVSSLGFLSNSNFVARQTPYDCQKQHYNATELVYPYLANTKYAYSLQRAESLIPNIVAGIQANLCNSSTLSIQPLHYLLSALLCYDTALRYQISTDTIRKIQEMFPKLIQFYFKECRESLKIYFNSYLELSRSRLNLQSDQSSNLENDIRIHFSKIKEKQKIDDLWSTKQGLFSLRLQLNYAWLLMN